MADKRLYNQLLRFTYKYKISFDCALYIKSVLSYQGPRQNVVIMPLMTRKTSSSESHLVHKQDDLNPLCPKEAISTG